MEKSINDKEQCVQTDVMQSVLKASDLRIGNLINYKMIDDLDPRKEWFEPSEVDIMDLLDLEANPNDEDFQPIPLTEEWLLKFGFEKLSQVPQYHIEDFHVYTTKNYSKIFGLHFDVKIKHVHQLQNLYFALTQRELTVA